jgi:hypothetical protein
MNIAELRVRPFQYAEGSLVVLRLLRVNDHSWRDLNCKIEFLDRLIPSKRNPPVRISSSLSGAVSPFAA